MADALQFSLKKPANACFAGFAYGTICRLKLRAAKADYISTE
jgi:hypothetical protein